MTSVIEKINDIRESWRHPTLRMSGLLGQPVEKLGDSQWIEHIIKRLHLLDDAGRKRSMDGMTNTIQPLDVLDMMRRYDVPMINQTR